MDVRVTGRHCQVSDEFRDHVMEKITKVERLRDRVISVDVQVSAYGNKRNPDEGARVEITLRSKGPVVRAEATADEKIPAFEQALDRLRKQLRRAADRRKIHKGHKNTSLAEAAAQLPPLPVEPAEDDEPQTRQVAGIDVTGDGPLVVREKVHPARPMTLAQAIDEMELVGHDFFLFIDADANLPAVTYKRQGYSYGVIRLDPAADSESTADLS